MIYNLIPAFRGSTRIGRASSSGHMSTAKFGETGVGRIENCQRLALNNSRQFGGISNVERHWAGSWNNYYSNAKRDEIAISVHLWVLRRSQDAWKTESNSGAAAWTIDKVGNSWWSGGMGSISKVTSFTRAWIYLIRFLSFCIRIEALYSSLNRDQYTSWYKVWEISSS